MIALAMVGCMVIGAAAIALGAAFGLGHFVGRHGIVVAVTDPLDEF